MLQRPAGNMLLKHELQEEINEGNNSPSDLSKDRLATCMFHLECYLGIGKLSSHERGGLWRLSWLSYGCRRGFGHQCTCQLLPQAFSLILLSL